MFVTHRGIRQARSEIIEKSQINGPNYQIIINYQNTYQFQTLGHWDLLGIYNLESGISCCFTILRVLNERYSLNRAVFLRCIAAVLKFTTFRIDNLRFIINDLKNAGTDFFAGTATYT